MAFYSIYRCINVFNFTRKTLRFPCKQREQKEQNAELWHFSHWILMKERLHMIPKWLPINMGITIIFFQTVSLPKETGSGLTSALKVLDVKPCSHDPWNTDGDQVAVEQNLWTFTTKHSAAVAMTENQLLLIELFHRHVMTIAYCARGKSFLQ